ncbi:class I SAM-dependent methyltransferase [Streptomyces atriruber]|uniref:class I SAM-dependent methyltransferase n=1 Tax=Streptomyces atriruber TaxID=545121 RepID=UPI0006E2360D|nr:class I SAM-dependent methyltransferase [Streptomyces atriruber]
MNEHLDEHYSRLANTYDTTWEHRPDYLEWMAGKIMDSLRPLPGERVADIGVGTGLFVERLMACATGDAPVLAVDPSQPMLDKLPQDPRVRTVRATAEELVDGRGGFTPEPLDAILIKEAVHHFSDLDRTLSGLAALLAPGGRVLVVTLPPKIDYPLFPAAIDRFAEGQPEPMDIALALRRAGLDVTASYERYSVEIQRDNWLELVRGRWMSVLSTFTDAELERGLQLIGEAHPQQRISFVETFAFVLGRLPDDA